MFPEVLVLELLETEQLSTAVGEDQVPMPEQLLAFVFTEMFAGQPVHVGDCASMTVMINEQEAELPEASVVLNVFVVLPIG